MSKTPGFLLTPRDAGGHDIRRVTGEELAGAPLPAGSCVVPAASPASTEVLRRIVREHAAGLRRLADR